MYEPTSAILMVVRSRVSPGTWKERGEDARRNEVAMAAIAGRVEKGETLNEAIRREVEPSRRSWVIKRWIPYRKEWFEALVDKQLPREPRLADACVTSVEAARFANPKLTVAEAIAILGRQKVKPPRKLEEPRDGEALLRRCP